MTTTPPTYLPLPFKDDMVRAILLGRKTQTRRIIKIPDWVERYHGGATGEAWPDLAWTVTPCLKVRCADDTVQRLRNPWGFSVGGPDELAGTVPDVRLWAREAHAFADKVVWGTDPEDPTTVVYRSDGTCLDWGWGVGGRYIPTVPDVAQVNFEHPSVKWRPGMFLPKWAARLVLRVLYIRAERLHDITEADAASEGVEPNWCGPVGGLGGWSPDEHGYQDYSLPEGWDGEGGVLLTARESFATLWDKINGRKVGFTWKDNPWVWRLAFERDPAPDYDLNVRE